MVKPRKQPNQEQFKNQVSIDDNLPLIIDPTICFIYSKLLMEVLMEAKKKQRQRKDFLVECQYIERARRAVLFKKVNNSKWYEEERKKIKTTT